MNVQSVAEKLLDESNRISFLSESEFVYMLFSHGEMVYVGTTKSLGQRIKVHSKTGRITFDSYSSAHLPSHKDAVNVERELIWKLKPKFNRQMTLAQYEGMSAEGLARKAARHAETARRRTEREAQFKSQPWNISEDIREWMEYNEKCTRATQEIEREMLLEIARKRAEAKL